MPTKQRLRDEPWAPCSRGAALFAVGSCKRAMTLSWTRHGSVPSRTPSANTVGRRSAPDRSIFPGALNIPQASPMSIGLRHFRVAIHAVEKDSLVGCRSRWPRVAVVTSDDPGYDIRTWTAASGARCGWNVESVPRALEHIAADGEIRGGMAPIPASCPPIAFPWLTHHDPVPGQHHTTPANGVASRRL